MKKRPKWYVVWRGRTPGIYTTWAECQKQVDGFADAAFKGFDTETEAKTAYATVYKRATPKPKPIGIANPKKFAGKGPIIPSISVDAAWNTATGAMEYRGVETDTGRQLFHQGPLDDGTNNVGEFLAIVHGLAYLKARNSELPIYSDSRNAIGWVSKGRHASKLERTARNAPIFDLLDRAVAWLATNAYPNKVLKWETQDWGENPADFGRK